MNAMGCFKQYYVLLLDLYKKICSSLIPIFWVEPGCSAVLCRYVVVEWGGGYQICIGHSGEHPGFSLCCNIHKCFSKGSFLMRFRMQSISKTPARSQHI